MHPPYKKPTPTATVIVRKRHSLVAERPHDGASPTRKHTADRVGASTPSTRSGATATCGHPLDPGRSLKKRCRACCRATVDADQAAARKRRQERAKKQVGKGRLPNGATFEATFNADKVLWTGKLTTVVRGEPRWFSATSTNVFSLLTHLDYIFRMALEEEGGDVANASATAPVAVTASAQEVIA